VFKIFKERWNKLSPDGQWWVIIFLVSIEAALFYRFFIPIDIKMEYGKSFTHVVNLLIHYAVLFPILGQFFICKGK
jgi:hypothetical protein